MVVPRGSTEVADAFAPPELFCPFEFGVCPHVGVVQPRSVRWAVQHRLVQSDSQRDKLERSVIARLEGLAFRDASRDVLQLATDWTTLFCVLDDHMELQKLGALRMAKYLQDILRGMGGEAGLAEDPVGRAFRDLHGRMLELAGERWTSRFVAHLADLFVGYVWEETNRWGSMRPELNAYRTMRTITIGLRLQFLFGELCLGVDLGERGELVALLRPLEDATCRAVGWANDLFTYQKEVAHGEIHNLVLVLMHTHQIPVAEALRRAAYLHDDEVRNLLALESALGEEVEPEVAGYVRMLQAWVRGHLDWATETGRYRQRASVPPLA